MVLMQFDIHQAIIKSREALSYGEAQARIDDPKDLWKSDGGEKKRGIVSVDIA